MAGHERVAYRVLALGGAVIGGRALRILAYHGIPDPTAFEQHVRLLRRHFYPIGLDEALSSRAGGLPRGATAITFDDGDPSVVTNGLPLLDRYGIKAAMFVCPGLVDSSEQYWWDRVPATDVGNLKTVPDEVRRRAVAASPAAAAVQLTTKQLRDWVDSGHSIGNHTWDHPCLDRCAPDEQARQVRKAHEWLHDHFGPRATTAFAYPNGNFAHAAEQELKRLGYRIGLLFDHALAGSRQDPLRLSRLRIDATATPSRARAIMSGGHSAAYQLRRRIVGH